MALGDQVNENLKEASGYLRNALAFAARNERPLVCTQIARLINDIDSIDSYDSIIDKLENHQSGN